jgi:hypothetical protein
MPFIAFKLAENSVKTIISIERIEPLKYNLKTDNGSYLVETTILPLPITKVEKIAPSVKTFNP